MTARKKSPPKPGRPPLARGQARVVLPAQRVTPASYQAKRRALGYTQAARDGGRILAEQSEPADEQTVI